MNTIWTPHAAAGYYVITDCPILFHRFRGLVAALVVEMQHDGLMADLQARHAEVRQALTQFTIRSAVLHVFIETIYGDEILLPS